MKGRRVFGIAFVAALAVMFGGGQVLAYTQYNDGCNSCHGAFTDATSTKGSIFPGDDKHTMHRGSQYMNTECALCHRSDDNNNPFMSSSDGTAANAGLGCNGCHEPFGLRRHHVNSGTGICTDCHSSDPTPPGESVRPAYYGTVDTQAANSCNPTAQTNVNENWTINCCLGLDNDGDGLYDLADPDCAGPTATPGEAGASQSLLVTTYDKLTGTTSISYGPACASTNNRIEYGPLSSVSTYAYSGQVCNIGNGGTASFVAPSGSSFFLVVANDTAKEGSYGKRKTGTLLAERPEDSLNATCPLPQDLALRCD